MKYPLDDYCVKIVVTLLSGKMRFNELEHSLVPGEMTTTTLSKHLKKHLVPAKFVVCKVEFEEEEPKVFYQLNFGRFQNFESFRKSNEELGKFMSETFAEFGLKPIDFNGLDWEEKIAQVWLKIFIRSLLTLKAQINFEVSPCWQNDVLFSLWKGSSGLEKKLVELCKNDKELREKVLKRLDELIYGNEPLLPFNKKNV